MGGSTKIFNDTNGVPTGNRPAAEVIKNFLAEAASGNNPPATTPIPTPSGTSKIIANFDLGLDGWNGGNIATGKNSAGALQINNPSNGSGGSIKQLNGMPIAGASAVEFDINLNGNRILDSLLGDAAQIAFEQSGQKGANLYKYVLQNESNGWQHIIVPLSDFADIGGKKLNLNGVLTSVSFRFWNDPAGRYFIDNLALTGGSTTISTPTPTLDGKVIANFDSGLDGWVDGKIVAGFNSTGSLEVLNPVKDSAGSKKSLNGFVIGNNYNTVELDINLKGAILLPGDASQFYFDQGGLRSIDLSDPRYVHQNGQNGWQHVAIPLSDFSGLNVNSGLAFVGFRFWNDTSRSYDLDNIIFTKR